MCRRCLFGLDGHQDHGRYSHQGRFLVRVKGSLVWRHIQLGALASALSLHLQLCMAAAHQVTHI
jgi:hypothetical protein